MNISGFKTTQVSLEESAELGCSKAQYQLAWHLIKNGANGLSIVKWLRRSAANNNGDAMLVLGRWYLGQFNTAARIQLADAMQARYWFKNSLKLGFIQGWEGLGDSYMVESKTEYALDYYKKAATLDCTAAMLKIANIYRQKELSDTKVLSEHLKWLTLAAELGNAEAQYYLALYFKNSLDTLDHLNQFELWLRASAAQGFPSACSELAELYYSGFLDIKIDYHKALTWMLIAAQQGNKKAYQRIAEMYRNGWGIQKDLAKAEKYDIEAMWLEDKTESPMTIDGNVTIN